MVSSCTTILWMLDCGWAGSSAASFMWALQSSLRNIHTHDQYRSCRTTASCISHNLLGDWLILEKSSVLVRRWFSSLYFINAQFPLRDHFTIVTKSDESLFLVCLFFPPVLNSSVGYLVRAKPKVDYLSNLASFSAHCISLMQYFEVFLNILLTIRRQMLPCTGRFDVYKRGIEGGAMLLIVEWWQTLSWREWSVGESVKVSRNMHFSPSKSDINSAAYLYDHAEKSKDMMFQHVCRLSRGKICL